MLVQRIVMIPVEVLAALRRACTGLCLLAGLLAPLAVCAQAIPEIEPTRVSTSGWYGQGQPALGTSANQNFISNAGFVVPSSVWC